MSQKLFAKYLWIIDTIERYGSISLDSLNRLWAQSAVSDGKPMSRRTFFNYRTSIADTFGIDIECNQSVYEYYIARDGSTNESKRQQWILDSMSISGALNNASEVASRIVLENVPSARKNLPIIIDAMKVNKRIRFDYRPYSRVNPAKNVIEPYFVKIFRQLWYVIGRNVKEDTIKTYALDRMSDLVITEDAFVMPPGFNPEEFFKYNYGITSSHDEPKDIVIRVDATQAKYFRALPLHPSQKEEIHDKYSIFSYRMCNTYDLRERLLSHGSAIEVLQPVELKLQIIKSLRDALKNYGQD